MTQQKSFKRKVRARMERTGESYTAARRRLLRDRPSAAPERPDDARPAPELPARVSDERLVAATGRTWDEWFALLDAAGGTGRTHRDNAARVVAEHGLPGWWAHLVVVEYERSRGMRRRHQRSDGTFRVTSSRTVAVPVGVLFAAVADPEVRQRWLPGADLEVTTSRPPRSFRARWGDTRLVVRCEEKGEGRSVVAVSHERLADEEEAAERKAFWGERTAALKRLLEG